MCYALGVWLKININKLNKKIMSVSIMECLQNAKYNLNNAIKMPMLMPMVKEQLNNAITLLDKGYGIWEEGSLSLQDNVRAAQTVF